MVVFMRDVMKKASKNVYDSIKNGKGIPSTLSMKSNDGKTRKLNKSQFEGLFEAENVFRLKKGRYPNYTTFNSTANNPLVLNYQDDSVSCACASFNMCIQMLHGIWVDEKQIKKTFGTTSTGTAPENMIKGAKKLGYKVEKISRNSTSVKKALSKGYPIMAHIDTKPASCLGYVNNYGHWVVIYRIDNTYYYVADPTKGLKKCKFSVLDKAMLNRTINYYSVKPL